MSIATPSVGLSQLADLVAVVLGGLSLLGRVSRLPALEALVSAEPATAVALMLLGLARLVAPRRATLARCGLALAASLALLTLGQVALGEPSGAARMSSDTALCVVLVAGTSWLEAGERQRRAAALLGATVTVVALRALLERAVGAADGRAAVMPLPAAAAFMALGATVVHAAWREAPGPRHVPFAGHLWRMVACLGALVVAFALDARAEGDVSRTHALRHRSFLLADELRQSGDDLTRMARTYVVTGDPVYARRFQDILAIRDGTKARPVTPEAPYWDLILGDGPPPCGDGPAVPLLELMREAGFTAEELGKLAQAKAHSDGLTLPELEAMRLVTSDADADRARATAMMFDASYHRAKAAVMGPIRECFVLLDARTLAAVTAAERRATLFRALFAVVGLLSLLQLWRTHAALGDTLGGSVAEVHAHLAALGRGDMTAPIALRPGLEHSVLGWVSQAQARLRDAERERSEAAAARGRLAAIVDSSTDAIIGKTLTGVVTSWNAGAERLLGLPAPAMLGQPVARVIPPDLLEEEERLRRRIAAGERIESHHTVRLGADGRRIDVSLSLSPVKDGDGRVIGVSTIARDIGDLKRAEEQVRTLNADLERRVRERTAQLEAANTELESFAYSVSHDLRAPLRGIDGWSQALLEDYRARLDAQGVEHLETVCAEAQRLGRLIDELLQLSRVSRGGLAREQVDLSALAGAVLAGLRARDPGRVVDTVVAPGLTATGDPALLRLVLENLLGNAWKFTGARAAARIELGQDPDTGELFVKDDGAGFDMAHAAKLFGPFQRLHRQTEFPGSGIGLATVQRILRRHGGRIRAQAAPGAGATFFFTLPEGP